MAYDIHSNSTVRSAFFKPIFSFFSSAQHTRECPALDDSTWIEAGVRRCLGSYQSGRDFLQELAELHQTKILRSTFFESLKSKRRLKLLDEINNHVTRTISKTLQDALSHYTCLADYQIFAGDGHFIAAATHDPIDTSTKSPTTAPESTTTRTQPTKYATGHLYTLNLRTHALTHLCVADQIERKKEHEMRALKRQTAAQLRQGAAKGKKTIYVWDRAVIDFRQWSEWKHQAGIYIISRVKDNMKLEVIGQYSYDKKAAINYGIIADEIVSTSTGVSVRRITYTNPTDEITYQYLTNLSEKIPPGLIAKLYKARWDIEKVFDEMKNKLEETKAWASSATAKTIQARLLCLTHNLMLLMEQEIEQRSGVKNTAELERRRKRREKETEHANKENKPQPPGLLERTERLTQRALKFVRWLRNHLNFERDWDSAVTSLAEIYSHI